MLQEVLEVQWTTISSRNPLPQPQNCTHQKSYLSARKEHLWKFILLYCKILLKPFKDIQVHACIFSFLFISKRKLY